jgi:hypothetical protein
MGITSVAGCYKKLLQLLVQANNQQEQNQEVKRASRKLSMSNLNGNTYRKRYVYDYQIPRR